MENAHSNSQTILMSTTVDDNELENDTQAVIFQCSRCCNIIGDSTAWVAATESLRTITLSRITPKAMVKKSLEVSQSGADKGSTYYVISCKACERPIGKQYVASPPELDHLRNFYTLDPDCLISYEVGSAEIGDTRKAGEAITMSVDNKLGKIQYVIFVLEERIRKLEQTVYTQVSSNNLPSRSGNSCTVEPAESYASSETNEIQYTD